MHFTSSNSNTLYIIPFCSTHYSNELVNVIDSTCNGTLLNNQERLGQDFANRTKFDFPTTRFEYCFLLKIIANILMKAHGDRKPEKKLFTSCWDMTQALPKFSYHSFLFEKESLRFSLNYRLRNIQVSKPLRIKKYCSMEVKAFKWKLLGMLRRSDFNRAKAYCKMSFRIQNEFHKFLGTDYQSSEW